MNNFESMPTPEAEASERKENFSDFDLQVGDRIVYDTRSDVEKETLPPPKDYYEVRRIVPFQDSEGTVLLQKYEYDANENRMKQEGNGLEASFDWVIQHQEHFLDIDQPRLPEGKTLEEYATSERLIAALNSINGVIPEAASPTDSYIAGTLSDPNVSLSERDRLRVAKANLIREIIG